MLTRDEFYSRMDRLEDNIGARIDKVNETLDVHAQRITVLEAKPKSEPPQSKWLPSVGTLAGTTIGAIGQYLFTILTKK